MSCENNTSINNHKSASQPRLQILSVELSSGIRGKDLCYSKTKMSNNSVDNCLLEAWWLSRTQHITFGLSSECRGEFGKERQRRKETSQLTDLGKIMQFLRGLVLLLMCTPNNYMIKIISMNSRNKTCTVVCLNFSMYTYYHSIKFLIINANKVLRCIRRYAKYFKWFIIFTLHNSMKHFWLPSLFKERNWVSKLS